MFRLEITKKRTSPRLVVSGFSLSIELLISISWLPSFVGSLPTWSEVEAVRRVVVEKKSRTLRSPSPPPSLKKKEQQPKKKKNRRRRPTAKDDQKINTNGKGGTEFEKSDDSDTDADADATTDAGRPFGCRVGGQLTSERRRPAVVAQPPPLPDPLDPAHFLRLLPPSTPSSPPSPQPRDSRVIATWHIYNQMTIDITGHHRWHHYGDSLFDYRVL